MRISFFILVVLIAFIAPWWLALPVAILYAFSRTAYELIALGMCLDAYYGSGSGLFGVPLLYTLCATIMVAAIELIKPYLSLYEG